MQNPPGFTLIEMIITLTIICLLASLTLPALTPFHQQTINQLTQSDLTHLIQQAIQTSRNQHMPIILCPTIDKQNCTTKNTDSFIVFIDKNQNGTLTSPSQLITSKTFSLQKDKLHTRLYPIYQPYFLFQPEVNNLTNNGSIWYCANHQSSPLWAVMLSKKGRTRVVLPNKSGVIKDSHNRLLTCDAF